MSEIEHLLATLRPTLRGIPTRELRSAMEGLEEVLERAPRRRQQLRLERLSFGGEKSGTFRFHPGVNVLRAGNDKGKSSLLKLIQLCLTGKSDLKKDVDGWISHIELAFELGGVPHAIAVQRKRRPSGRLVRGRLEDLSAETLLEFGSGKEMQRKLEAFFNEAFGLRPLLGTQKDSRKGSDALLDSVTSYRAYFRGMYVNQDLGYTALVTDGVPYGNLFMKVVGMLLGMHGIDAVFAVEARLAHLESALGKEERYHRRLEESLGQRDLATLDEEINKLERYIDELKVERTALFVRSTGSDLDQRMRQLTAKLVALDNAQRQTSGHLQEAELEMRATQRGILELETALAGARTLAPIQPERCPVCETAIAERRSHRQTAAGECVLCHEELPERDDAELADVIRQRLEQARSSLQELHRAADARRAEIEEIEFKGEQLSQQKRHLQSQLRSAFQATEELEREIELESRYLGRLEAEREGAARVVGDDGASANVRQLMQRKLALSAVLRHLRTRHADENERRKQELAQRVQEYCTTIGFPGLEEVRFDAGLRPRIRQNAKDYTFDELSPGEKVRFVLAFHLALAIATGEDLEHGAHPGLLLIDSPGKEEMVARDFGEVVHLLRLVEERHAESLQVIVATSLPAIRDATAPDKQVFVDNDDDPLFA